jgi:hypothetical protein
VCSSDLCAAYWQLIGHPLRVLNKDADLIGVAIGRFSADHEMQLPVDLQVLVEQGYLENWPVNPYGSGRMKLQALGAPPQPGGLVYLTNASTTAASHLEMIASSSSHQLALCYPLEVTTFELVFYDRGWFLREPPKLTEWDRNHMGYGLNAYNLIPWNRVALHYRPAIFTD